MTRRRRTLDQQLLGIGEFAAACQLSPRQLRHYHRLGLLTPARVEEGSGYRYYAADQLRPAALIAALRQAAMPLDEIAAVLSGGPRAAGRALTEHRRRLSAARAAEIRQLEIAERLVAKEATMTLEISAEHTEPVVVIKKRVEGPRSFAEPLLTAAFLELSRARDAAGVERRPPIQLIHASNDSRFVHEACCPIAAEDHVPGYNTEELPATDAAVATYSGLFSGLNPALHEVVAWIKQRGWNLQMPIRMEFLATPPLLGGDGDVGSTTTKLYIPYQD